MSIWSRSTLKDLPLTNTSKSNVLKHLEKILQTESFVRSKRLSNFLEYIVRNTLDTQDVDLKGYTVGVDVFGKPSDFDPDTDASVRVEAGRLRKALQLYYHEEGRDDEIQISVPKGSYRPLFSLVVQEGNKNKASVAWPKYLALIALGCFLLFIAGFVLWDQRDGVRYEGYDGIPVIAVLPFEFVGSVERGAITTEAEYTLIENLNKFNTLRSLSVDNIGDGRKYIRSAEIAKNFNADFVIEGKIYDRKGSVSIKIRMLDVKKTTYIWTYEKALPQGNDDTLAWIKDVTGEIASQLGSPYGVVQNIEQDRMKDSVLSSDDTYRCVLMYYAYANNKTSEGHLKTRECLTRIVEEEPQDSDAWAYLSWIYGNEIRYSHNPEGTVEEIYKKSLDAAKKSLKADPRNPRAHQYMANAAMFNNFLDLAEYHVDMSIELNPYDSEILADAAWNYGQIGLWEKSKLYGERAVSINPGHARWYHGILFGYHYFHGDYESALYHATESYQPEVLSSSLALAVAYQKSGRIEDALIVFRTAQAKFPEAFSDVQNLFSGWRFRESFVRKFASDIKALLSLAK